MVQEIEQIVENKFENRINEFSPKSEVQLLRKDMETMRVELSAKIESFHYGLKIILNQKLINK